MEKQNWVEERKCERNHLDSEDSGCDLSCHLLIVGSEISVPCLLIYFIYSNFLGMGQSGDWDRGFWKSKGASAGSWMLEWDFDW